MSSHLYTVEIEPLKEGGYFVTVPALPGCMTQGETYEEALSMAEDAIRLWVDTLKRRGEPVPVEPAPSRTMVAILHVHTAAVA